ncbi:hypothetical protein HAL1_06620 [Halomonas sp. HAL1]|nr:hypothetical protein HAL1_06620 [Halomonas sp. HAL1]
MDRSLMTSNLVAKLPNRSAFAGSRNMKHAHARPDADAMKVVSGCVMIPASLLP